LAPLFACLALTLTGGSILAQESAESRAFKAATNAFHDGIYERAEREFAEYAQKFPD
jgi:TolA-binding protein